MTMQFRLRQSDTQSNNEPQAGAAVEDPQTGAVIEDKKSKKERWFVARLDVLVLVYCCFTQVIKGLDQQNISAAYVSGMKEDLGVKQNEYNLFTTYFNIGYCLFVVPSQIVLTYVRPSWWLPGLEFAWGLLTLGLYKVTNVNQIYVLRAFIGMFEGSSFPGGVTILMSWYTPHELAFRIAFFQSSQFIGSMMSGGLQAAIYRGLNGAGGLEGWRWMFVVDAIITLVVAAAGFILIPDYPTKPNPFAFWLRKDYIDLGIERQARFRRADTKRVTLGVFRRIVKNPLLYLIPIFYIASMLAHQGYQYFNLFLKSLKNPDGSPLWSVEAVNAIPIGGYAVAVVISWAVGFFSDRIRSRWLFLLGISVVGLIPAIIMTVWEVPLPVKYMAYFMSYMSLAPSPIFFAWLSDLTPHQPEERALIVGACVTGYYSQNSWANVLIWPASQAPHYKVAWQVIIGLWLFFMAGVCLLRYIEIKYIRPRNQRIAEELQAAREVVLELSRDDLEGEKKGAA